MPIEYLMEPLKKYTIEERFFEHFHKTERDGKKTYQICPISTTKEGNTLFFGNFEEFSHVFRIETDEPELIEKLSNAIMNNAGWHKYYEKNKAQ